VSYCDVPSGTVRVGHLAQPRLEPEIIFHFKSAPHETCDEHELLSHVDWIAHGCEIVQSHFADWSFQAADTVAAFGLHGALVVGPRQPVHDIPNTVIALRTFTATLDTPGRPTLRGGGSDVLGSPLLAVAHLLTMLKNQPEFEPLGAGELVTTGTLLSPPPICPGEIWTTDLSGLSLPGLRLAVVA
jgi:2-oxo-3-hexenedioate decarboxylase